MKRKLQLNESGQALIFISLAFVILGMFVGLVVDGGRAYLMRERLRKIVDAAALAGAKAMAAAPEGTDEVAAARDAACQSAMVNGLSQADCANGKFTVTVEPVMSTDGVPQRGVVVTGTDRARTFFIALGGLIGCENCNEVNVLATGRAVPDTLADVVLVLDDTGTMKCTGSTSPTECAIEGAKSGARGLIETLFRDPGSHAMVGYVPFRGCYSKDNSSRYQPQSIINAYRAQNVSETDIARRGCIFYSEMVGLTKDTTALTNQINSRVGSPGFPGTNICLAMIEARDKLFGQGAREIARKIMIILTDGSQNYSDFSDGGPNMVINGSTVNTGIPNMGNPTPSPYPNRAYLNPGGDQGSDSTPSCKAIDFEPGSKTLDIRWANNGSFFNDAIAELDKKANALATTLKQTRNVEIYVLRYTASTDGDSLTTGDPPGSCDPDLIGRSGVQRGGVNGQPDDNNASNDPRDRNFARCIASNLVMKDPGAVRPNDHYFFAATPAQITAAFEAIAADILKKRRLVG